MSNPIHQLQVGITYKIMIKDGRRVFLRLDDDSGQVTYQDLWAGDIPVRGVIKWRERKGLPPLN